MEEVGTRAETGRQKCRFYAGFAVSVPKKYIEIDSVFFRYGCGLSPAILALRLGLLNESLVELYVVASNGSACRVFSL